MINIPVNMREDSLNEFKGFGAPREKVTLLPVIPRAYCHLQPTDIAVRKIGGTFEHVPAPTRSQQLLAQIRARETNRNDFDVEAEIAQALSAQIALEIDAEIAHKIKLEAVNRSAYAYLNKLCDETRSAQKPLTLDVLNPFFDELTSFLKDLSGFTSNSTWNSVDIYSGINAVIAGGCIRDTLLGREVKDIDVFVHMSPTAFNNLPGRFKDSVITSKQEEYTGAFSVIDMQLKDMKYPVQFINVANVSAHIDTFCFGLSKVWLDENGVHLTNEFLSDVKNKKITLLQSNIADGYMDRIHDKYPDFTVDFNDIKNTTIRNALECYEKC